MRHCAILRRSVPSSLGICWCTSTGIKPGKNLSQAPDQQTVAVGRSVAHVSIDANIWWAHADEQIIPVQHLHLHFAFLSGLSSSDTFTNANPTFKEPYHSLVSSGFLQSVYYQSPPSTLPNWSSPRNDRRSAAGTQSCSSPCSYEDRCMPSPSA